MTAWLRSPPGFTTSIGQDETDSSDKRLATTTANTKGSYVELVASSLFDATGIVLNIGKAHSTQADFLVDIAVGAASSEQIIIENLLICKSSLVWAYADQLYVPISIPAGTRISARMQTTDTIEYLDISAYLQHGGCFADDTFSICHSMGPDTSDTGGVVVDPGTTADTKGSYAQIVASSEFDCEQIIVAMSGRHNSSNTTHVGLLDIAVGAAASEQVILSNISYVTHGGHDIIRPNLLGPIPFHVPAGTRISARCQSSITDATDRLIDVALYGIC